MLRDPKLNLSVAMLHHPVEIVEPDIVLHDGDTLSVGSIEFRAMHTPGHTHGSYCLITQDTIFSGDTLFCDGYGRTDGPTASQYEMEQSLKKLASLKGEYQVLPGHGNFTTLSHECQNNPLMKKDSNGTIS